jgi:hypothetical protein
MFNKCLFVYRFIARDKSNLTRVKSWLCGVDEHGWIHGRVSNTRFQCFCLRFFNKKNIYIYINPWKKIFLYFFSYIYIYIDFVHLN